ncbi:PREDICTED: peptide chain release factor 1-like, mitochondrial isoform X2 [Priapulus caudatus]|nr:PREDICTED: peptide chain release factor 1-like, mitochondrial isoform X2 [Priapulus caudatus]XP_014672966.1 PREDICTED: peptide chain release factor 1-like, mitochondrial isoform X2 [Priapulus caudatus]
MSRLNSLQPLIEVGLNMQEKRKELLDLNTLIADSATDSEMMCAALEEKNSCEAEIRKLDEQVIELLLPNETLDDNDIILEVSAGIGGQEAMLFAQDMFLLYENYAAEMGWSFDIYEHVHTEIGGLRRASAGISGQCAYKHLKFESGVHRVQRVPKTEKAGRIHTSTVTVAIMPQPKEIDIVIHPKDITIECTRSSGKGGQSVNTTDSCVRIVHKPTGVVSECQTERSQMQNRERAMKVLRTRLYNVKVEKQQEEERSHRKLQVGSKSRSEKVRTYNYQQDRITDHRIGVNRFHIPEFMSGGSKFHDLVLALLEADRRERLVELLEKANNPNERS